MRRHIRHVAAIALVVGIGTGVGVALAVQGEAGTESATATQPQGPDVSAKVTDCEKFGATPEQVCVQVETSDGSPAEDADPGAVQEVVCEVAPDSESAKNCQPEFIRALSEDSADDSDEATRGE